MAKQQQQQIGALLRGVSLIKSHARARARTGAHTHTRTHMRGTEHLVGPIHVILFCFYPLV